MGSRKPLKLTITIEGRQGAGKTRMLAALYRILRLAGYRPTVEDGGQLLTSEEALALPRVSIPDAPRVELHIRTRQTTT